MAFKERIGMMDKIKNHTRNLNLPWIFPISLVDHQQESELPLLVSAFSRPCLFVTSEVGESVDYCQTSTPAHLPTPSPFHTNEHLIV
jgi:hypothetical protein